MVPPVLRLLMGMLARLRVSWNMASFSEPATSSGHPPAGYMDKSLEQKVGAPCKAMHKLLEGCTALLRHCQTRCPSPLAYKRFRSICGSLGHTFGSPAAQAAQSPLPAEQQAASQTRRARSQPHPAGRR